MIDLLELIEAGKNPGFSFYSKEPPITSNSALSLLNVSITSNTGISCPPSPGDLLNLIKA